VEAFRIGVNSDRVPDCPQNGGHGGTSWQRKQKGDNQMPVKNTKNVKKTIVNEFPCDLMECADDGMGVVTVGTHTYYNLDGKEKLPEWIQVSQRVTLISCIATTNGIKLRKPGEGSVHARTCQGAIGFINMHSNCVEKNAQYVGLYSFPCTDQGYNVLPENFDRAVSGFAARRLVEDNVWNHQDCYMKPNVDHPKYAEWQKDCYIFSMFESKSNQTSIKGEVGGEAYEFVNQFYPFTKEETFDFLSWDKKVNFKNEVRYIRSSGKLDNLTTEGQAVLDAFKKCLMASASARSAYHEAHKELQVKRWDCGWRQLKKLFEEACPAEFADLKAKFKVLKEKMLPMVYELGFLKK
jgi:hypothetical protein